MKIYPIFIIFLLLMSEKVNAQIIEEVRAVETTDLKYNPKKKTPTKRVYFNFQNKDIRDVSIYLYCPEMENDNFRYDSVLSLGAENNIIRFFQQERIILLISPL